MSACVFYNSKRLTFLAIALIFLFLFRQTVSDDELIYPRYANVGLINGSLLRNLETKLGSIFEPNFVFIFWGENPLIRPT